MIKKQNMIPLKNLNLTNRFLFDEVMEDPDTHRDALSIILGKDISPLKLNQTEKENRLSPTIRSIRMDVFSIDEEDTIYNTEMQEKRKADLAKRSRYYQSLTDTGLLEPGIPNYNLLNDSYIIMIMPFDLFGYGKYVYTFEADCQEVPECKLKDGATRIFLNTHGTNDDEISKELADFLHYLEDTTSEKVSASDSSRIKRIHDRVCKVKLNEEVGVRYMQAWEEKYYSREEGREEGFENGVKSNMIELIQKKLKKGKSISVIADELETDVNTISELIQEMEDSKAE